MNRWQKHYINTLYDGNMPRSKVGKYELDLLGNVKDSITVHFPDFDSPIKSQCRSAHNKTYAVTLNECNMPEGIISVEVLAGNLALWTDRGYRIDY